MDVGLGIKCENTGIYMDTRKDKIIRPNKKRGKQNIYNIK